MTEPQAVRWPWWMAPARLIGRIRPGLAATVQADAMALERLPRLFGTVAVPLMVVAIAAAFAALHAASGPRTDPPIQLEWLNLLMYNIYTEVPLFIIAACVIGALSPAAAVLFVLSFGAFDLIASATSPEELRFWALRPFPIAGRLIAYWLLWLLAVEIPVMGRVLAISVRGLADSRLVVAAVCGIATGTFTWLWTLATPVLLRPVYLWSDIGGPYAELGLQLDKGGMVFALIAGATAAAFAMLAGPGGLMQVRQWPAPAQVGQPAVGGKAIAVIRRLIVAGLLTIGLGGLITTAVDAAFLFVAFAGVRPLVQWLADRTPIPGLAQLIPAPARIALAMLAVFGVALLTVGVPALASISEFFPLIAALAVGLFIVEFIMASGKARQQQRRSIAQAASVGVLLGLALVAFDFVAPNPVLADNYITLHDIWATIVAIAGAVTGLTGAVVLASWTYETWFPPPPPPKPSDSDELTYGDKTTSWTWDTGASPPQAPAPTGTGKGKGKGTGKEAPRPPRGKGPEM